MKGILRTAVSKKGEDPAASEVSNADLVKPDVIRVLGEGEDNILCEIAVDEGGRGMDLATLKVMICSRLDSEGLFPELAPSSIELHSHPQHKPILNEYHVMRGGCSVHMHSNKGRADASATDAGGLKVYFSEDLFLQVPYEHGIESWLAKTLDLGRGTHQLVLRENGQFWYEPVEFGQVLEDDGNEDVKAIANPAAARLGVSNAPTFVQTTLRDKGSSMLKLKNRFPVLQESNNGGGGSGSLPPMLSSNYDTSGWPYNREQPAPAGKGEDEVQIYGEIYGGYDDEPTATHAARQEAQWEEEVQLQRRLEEEGSVPTKRARHEATLYLPDGSTIERGLPPEGLDAQKLLEALCWERGWSASLYGMMEHSLPIFALWIYSGCSYDVKPRRIFRGPP
jgi:hypothetical protein